MFKRKEGDDEDDDFSCAEDSSHQIDKGEREQLGQQLAHKGHNVVKGLRVGLFASLLLATVLASVSIFLYTRDQEELAFEDAFADNSLKIVEAFKTTAERRLSAVASFGTTITSYTLAVNATWPFVTVPQFEARSSHILNLAEAIAIAFAPLVYPKDRETWENDYVPSNIGWIEESFQYQENVLKGASEGTSAINDAAVVDEEASSNNGNAPPPTYEGMPDFSAGYSKQIFTTGFTPLGELGPLISEGDVFLPWWQRAPSSRSEGAGFINIDLVDDPSFGGDLVQVLKRRRAALGRMSFGGYTDDVNAPISGFYYPIIDGMDMYDPTANLVGATATLVYWDTYFANILPQNANGIIAVLSNTCNQTVTFQIDGPTVTVLGQGDLHDTKYDDFRQDVSFSSTINERSASRSYLGFPLDEEGCQYTLSVYASEEFEDIYVSSMPIIYMVGTVFIFFLTSGLFILYDRLVTNRQQAILRQAEQSGAIVSSLFPAMYRDRLIKAHEDVLERRNGPRDNGKNIKTFANQALDDSGKTIDNDEPIADLYSDCTVLFADIAGFTAWSSTHDPGQVFTLLQTLFAAFDSIAKKRKVFKVETIGDCYLAVTGLPSAQPDHCMIMAKFANEILLKTQELTADLAGQLGEETRQLSLRIGLHSGPVTAGILKGDKSRFQLFGDTVNTASRMESTGEKNRIQLSPTTAQILRNGNKSHWLVKRDELVSAKGKETMQTYWLSPPGTGSVAESTTGATAPVQLNAMRTYLAEQLSSSNDKSDDEHHEAGV